MITKDEKDEIKLKVAIELEIEKDAYEKMAQESKYYKSLYFDSMSEKYLFEPSYNLEL